jgi:hypothetical protein
VLNIALKAFSSKMDIASPVSITAIYVPIIKLASNVLKTFIFSMIDVSLTVLKDFINSQVNAYPVLIHIAKFAMAKNVSNVLITFTWKKEFVKINAQQDTFWLIIKNVKNALITVSFVTMRIPVKCAQMDFYLKMENASIHVAKALLKLITYVNHVTWDVNYVLNQINMNV